MRNKLHVILTLLILLVMVSVIASPVLASDISSALYSGKIRVTNDGSATSSVSTNFTLSSASLVSDNYASANMTDMAIQLNGTDVAFMPSANATYPWSVWVPSIASLVNVDYDLYTGGVTGGKIRYFPNDGGMNTPDHASIEPSDISIEQKGWVDTDNATAKNLVFKAGAIRTFVSPTVSGNITSMLSTWVLATGFNDPGAVWSNDSNASDGDTGTNAFSTVGIGAGAWSDYLEISMPAFECWGMRVFTAAATTVPTVDVDLYYDGGWQNFYEENLANDTWAELFLSASETATGARIRMRNNGPGAEGMFIKELQLSGEDISVTATGVASGEHTVKTEAGTALGNTLEFSGAADSVINAGAIHNNIPKLWISFRFKLDQDFTGGSGTPAIFGKLAGGADYITLNFENNGKLRWKLVTGGVPSFTIFAQDGGGDIVSWNAGQWYHVLASLSDTVGIGRLTVDGGPVVLTNDVNPVPNGGDFHIGNGTVLAANNFEGVIADFLCGTDNLNGAEEANLAIGIPPGDEVNYWYIDEGTGVVITDYGTSGNDGVADAGTSWTTGDRPYYFSISVDGALRGGRPLNRAPVPDTSADWIFVENYSMPYLESHEIEIGGVQAQYIEWEYGTTFEDQSANTNDATPTFRTASSDADVSAEIISFSPVAEAEVATFTLGSVVDILTGTPENISQLYTELDFDHIPGAEAVNELLSEGDIPQALWWFPFIYISIAIIGLLTYGATRLRGGNGSLLTMCIVVEVLLALAGVMNPVPFWPALLFPIPAIATIVSQKHFSWG